MDASHPVRTLLRVLDFLQQGPPAEFARGSVETILEWAVQNWEAARLRGIHTLPAPGKNG